MPQSFVGTVVILDNYNIYIIVLLYFTRGTEAEIQLPLKRFPDSSLSSLILVGWCEEGHPTTKNLLQHSQG